jgi:hypothetical protein
MDCIHWFRTPSKEFIMAEFGDQLRDISKDISSESQRIMNDAQERAAAFYDESKDFVRENQTPLLIGLGFGVLLGVTGFFLGRASKTD